MHSERTVNIASAYIADKCY